MTYTHSTGELVLQAIRAVAFLLMVGFLLRAAVGPGRAGASGSRLGRRSLLLAALGSAVIGSMAHAFVPAPDIHALETPSPACELRGKEYVCSGDLALALPALDGWEFSFDAARHHIAARLRENDADVAILHVSMAESDAPNAAELASGIAAAVQSPAVKCATSTPTELGNQISGGLDCEGAVPYRVAIAERGGGQFTLLQCSSKVTSACNPLISAVRWITSKG